MTTTRPAPPLVSVVVVNYRTPDLTLECLEAVAAQRLDHGTIEVICVDNGSDGVIAARLAARADEVRLLESPRNLGFGAGCNLGVRAARGAYLAFVNSDAVPEAGWLSNAVAVLDDDATIGCVASRVLSADGSQIDYVDAAMTWFGMGYKPAAGQPYDAQRPAPAGDVLFATGAAMVVRAEAFAQAGGFDERYFMFYEDVDLGWRLNLLGHRVRYVPDSAVRHRHHASFGDHGEEHEWFLLERNALFTLYKNLDDRSLGKALAPALALGVRRAHAVAGVEPTLLDIAGPGPRSGTVELPLRALAAGLGIDAFVDHLPGLQAARAEIQARRTRSDRELLPLFRDALEPALPAARYLAAHAALVDAFDVPSWASSPRVLVVTEEPLGAERAGPSIRASAIARVLASEHEVRLLTLAPGPPVVGHGERFTTIATTPEGLRTHVAWCDVVITQGFVLEHAPWLATAGRAVVCDLYDPIHLEQLEQTRHRPPVGGPTQRRAEVLATTAALSHALREADLLLCANEPQRNLWLGQLSAVGRLVPALYDADPTLDSLLAVVPSGVSAGPPAAAERAIRGVVPGIGREDRVVLWAGGVYDWFDPVTAIEAIASLRVRHTDCRLLFLGTTHPNPRVAPSQRLREARARADDLGLTGTAVFFNDGWVPYADRPAYLLDSDVGISTHLAGLEATFAYRTRILDHLWAGLPSVLSAGDSLSGLVAERGAGITVEPGDVEAVAEALEALLYDDRAAAACTTAARALADELTWEHTLAPLREFCRDPRPAADRRGDRRPVPGRPRARARSLLRVAGARRRDG